MSCQSIIQGAVVSPVVVYKQNLLDEIDGGTGTVQLLFCFLSKVLAAEVVNVRSSSFVLCLGIMVPPLVQPRHADTQKAGF